MRSAQFSVWTLPDSVVRAEAQVEKEGVDCLKDYKSTKIDD